MMLKPESVLLIGKTALITGAGWGEEAGRDALYDMNLKQVFRGIRVPTRSLQG
jgi:hypothetical protein